MGEKGKHHFILVHGMGHGAWCWYKLSRLLQAAGHRVTTLDLAASSVRPQRLKEVRSFWDYTKILMELMVLVPPQDKVVLIGHSYGGASVALAMELFPEKALVAVFTAAMMPSPTCSVTIIAQEFFKGHPLEAYMESKIETSQEPPTVRSISFGYNYMSTRLYQLSPPEDLTLATTLVRPASFFLHDVDEYMIFTEENYASVRRVYIVCKEDKSMSEGFQLWITRQSPKAEVRKIEGDDHMVMLSRPKELFDLLLEIVDERH